jgi:hypothetical protein
MSPSSSSRTPPPDGDGRTQLLAKGAVRISGWRNARPATRPGARALVLDTDWDSIVWHSGDPLRTQRVLDAWEEHIVDPHLPRKLIGLLDDAG